MGIWPSLGHMVASIGESLEVKIQFSTSREHACLGLSIVLYEAHAELYPPYPWYDLSQWPHRRLAEKLRLGAISARNDASIDRRVE